MLDLYRLQEPIWKKTTYHSDLMTAIIKCLAMHTANQIGMMTRRVTNVMVTAPSHLRLTRRYATDDRA